MRVFHLRKNIHFRPIINLDRIATLVPRDVLDQARNNKGQTLQVDVTKYGFHKVLGKGQLSFPLVVRAKFFSREAERRIRAAGGACVLTA
jgi:large subunit ribosomal protein L27Ae